MQELSLFATNLSESYLSLILLNFYSHTTDNVTFYLCAFRSDIVHRIPLSIMRPDQWVLPFITKLELLKLGGDIIHSSRKTPNQTTFRNYSAIYVKYLVDIGFLDSCDTMGSYIKWFEKNALGALWLFKEEMPVKGIVVKYYHRKIYFPFLFRICWYEIK